MLIEEDIKKKQFVPGFPWAEPFFLSSILLDL